MSSEPSAKDGNIGIKAQLRKIYNLSVRGSAGEAENAKRKLDDWLVKYNLSISDILADETAIHEFRYRTEFEKRLILQCYLSIGGDRNKIFGIQRGGKKQNIVAFELSKLEHEDLKERILFYKKSLEDEFEMLFMAFVQKHRLYAPSSGDGDKESNMSKEDILRMLALMNGISGKSFAKTAGLLEGGK